MVEIHLGRGDDDFSVQVNDAGFPNGSSVFGGNGDDTIVIGTGGPHGASWSGLLLSGDRGDDTIRLLGGFQSTLRGGNGEDELVVTGSDNRLEGGRGDDQLSSSIQGTVGNRLCGGAGDDTLSSFTGPISGLIRGDILTGGPGDDTFKFDAGPNFSAVHVSNDQDGVVSGGDAVTGNFAVVTDYGGGDRLVLGATTAVEDAVALSATGAMSIPRGSYATFRGDLDPEVATRFTVDPEGPDLLVVFDTPASHPAGFYGSVVLENFTRPDLLIFG